MDENAHEEAISDAGERGLNRALLLAVLAIVMQLAMAGFYLWREVLSPQPQAAQGQINPDDLKQWQQVMERELKRPKAAVPDLPLREDVARLRQQLEALEQHAQQPAVAMLEMKQQMAALNDALKEIEALQAEVSSAQTAQEMARSLAFQRLKEQLEAGREFVLELETLRRSLPDEVQDTAVMDRLASLSVQTVPTQQQLQEQFAQLREEEAVPPVSDAPDLWSGVKQNLLSLVKIRKIGAEHEGSDDASLVARAEVLVREGRLQAAFDEIYQGTPPLQQHYAPWLQKVNFHLRAQEDLQELRQMLLLRALVEEQA